MILGGGLAFARLPAYAPFQTAYTWKICCYKTGEGCLNSSNPTNITGLIRKPINPFSTMSRILPSHNMNMMKDEKRADAIRALDHQSILVKMPTPLTVKALAAIENRTSASARTRLSVALTCSGPVPVTGLPSIRKLSLVSDAENVTVVRVKNLSKFMEMEPLEGRRQVLSRLPR